jgi:hypothetical protein
MIKPALFSLVLVAWTGCASAPAPVYPLAPPPPPPVEVEPPPTEGPGSCIELIYDLVASTAEARALLDGPTDPAHGHPSNGMREGTPNERGIAMVAVHESHETHLATLGWFEVDTTSGLVRDAMSEKPIAGDPALAAKMVTACAAKIAPAITPRRSPPGTRAVRLPECE